MGSRAATIRVTTGSRRAVVAEGGMGPAAAVTAREAEEATAQAGAAATEGADTEVRTESAIQGPVPHSTSQQDA